MKKCLKICAILLAASFGMSMTAISAEKNEFTDVIETDYFYPAVMWGTESGIAYGVGDNLFNPDGKVTRAQAVTFLWRMADKPVSENTETFSDVEKDSWYEAAVQWAVEKGITEGTGDGNFSPDEICDRAMCLTFLYRLMGAPLDAFDLSTPLSSDSKISAEDMTMEDFGVYLIKTYIETLKAAMMFPDVKEDSYYRLPVIWGSLNGIITNENTGTLGIGVEFRAEDPCLRKEMISFLYQTKLINDAANAPMTYEMGPITVPVPTEYLGLVSVDVFGVNESDEEEDDDEDEVVIIVSETASREAAEAMGEDTDGIGELFRIVRISEKRLHDLLCGDMSGLEVFAKDESGKYYMLCYPTDVRYMRESNEKMNEDKDQWTMLNSWARGDLDKQILENSKGLSEVPSHTNTLLDMYLARILYSNDIKYTVSTTEFGPLEPDKVDGTEYVSYLLGRNFAEEDTEAPDGEYVVLNFPEEGVRYDFFSADKNLVREVRDDYETFYRPVKSGEKTTTETMQDWYYAIAKSAGKITE